METVSKDTDNFIIQSPQNGDEVLIGPMHHQAWLESYLNPDLGVTEGVINSTISFTLTEESNKFRKNLFEKAASEPKTTLYKIVKNKDGKVVGFLHGSQNENQNELEGIYLINEAKGIGVGSKLMEEFLKWANPQKSCHLQVIAFNERALNFYTKFGFIKTDKQIEPYKGKFPIVEMVRPVSS